MKIFRRMLMLGLVLCLVALFLAVGGRIYLQENYPADSLRMVFTEQLTEYYHQTDDFRAYTQSLRTPYDSAKEGNFFAKGLIVVPDGGHLQITLRYNESALDNVADLYGLEQPLVATEGMFSFRLYACYGEQNGEMVYRTYDTSYTAESSRAFYHYIKTAFDGVKFDGAVWMRVDIYYSGSDKCFGSIPVYEAGAEVEGQFVEYPLQPYRISKELLPQ